MTKIELSSVWEDAKALGNANRDLLSAVAGMFLLLPAIVSDQVMVGPQPVAKGASNEVIVAHLIAYFSTNWPVLLVYGLVTAFGALAIYVLLLRPGRLTVSESLRGALFVLPGYFIANILQSFAMAAGFMLFVLPGLYIIARLAVIGPAAAAEKLTNPIAILRRSVQLTRGNGWRIVVLFAIIFVIFIVVSTLINSLLGIALTLLLPGALGHLLLSIVSSLIETAMAVIFILVSAALYRTLSVASARAWQP